MYDNPTALDPDDTSACPIAEKCEVCRDGELLTVVTALTTLGLICLTTCDHCARGPVPALSVSEAMRRVERHAVHLDAGLDEISAALEAESR